MIRETDLPSLPRPVPPASQFLLLRHGRNVIQDGAMRDHLLRLPRFEWMCPVQEVFYRRAGAR